MKNMKNNLCIRLMDVANLKGKGIKLPPNKVYQLHVSYPLYLDATFLFPIKTGKNGMGYIDLLKKIYDTYIYIYNHEDDYGVWGHSMDDLFIEGVEVNHKKKLISLRMGS